MRDLPVNTILVGDVRERLRELPGECVQCVVTSPPYWALRDYGVDGQLGLEKTPEEYVARMVEVFRQVRRVLRNDGTLWLNLGDSYAATGKSGGGGQGKRWEKVGADAEGPRGGKWSPAPPGLKPKDLVGIPWRMAFALQADGWYLRSDIIWSKPNPMPESVTDRPAKAHEYLFLMSKSERYYYDAEAVAETAVGPPGGNIKPTKGSDQEKMRTRKGLHLAQQKAREAGGFVKRSRRTVWTIPTSPFPEAHFAVFPEKVVEPCILAGTSEKGYCSDCGKPWIRNTAHKYEKTRPNGSRGIKTLGRQHVPYGSARYKDRLLRHTTTIGWEASCSCKGSVEPGVVLDPFMGSGTTALVALKAGRRFIGIELNPEYAKMAEARIWQEKNQRSLL